MEEYVLRHLLFFLCHFFFLFLAFLLLSFLACWFVRLLGFSLGFSAQELFGLRPFGFLASPASWLSSWLLGFSVTPPPRFEKVIHAYGTNSCQHHVCSGGRLCGSFGLQMRGARPRFLRPSMLAAKSSPWGYDPPFQGNHGYNKKHASCHHHTCSQEKLRGSFSLANGTQPPGFKGHPCLR